MRYIVIVIISFSLGLIAGVVANRVERSDDFSNVYFNSGPDLPADCFETDKPLLFYRDTDRRLFYCDGYSWTEAETNAKPGEAPGL